MGDALGEAAEVAPHALTDRLALRRSAKEAIDQAALAGADVRVAIRRELFEYDTGRYWHPSEPVGAAWKSLDAA
jgi:hypothetical protein